MEDNKKSQNKPHNDDPRKTTLSEQPSAGDNSSFDTETNLFDSEGEDFIDLTEIVDVADRLEGSPSPAPSSFDDDDIPIDLEDIVPVDEADLASVRDQTTVGDDDTDLIDLTDIVPVEQLGANDVLTATGLEGDEDEIIELTDTVWPKEPEEAAEADEMAPLAPNVAESDTDDFGDAFIDITDIDLTDLQVEEETPISSAVNGDGEEEVLELSDDFSMDAAGDPSSATVETMNSESDLSQIEPSDENETTDDGFASADQIEGIDPSDHPVDSPAGDDEGRIGEDIADLDEISEIAESEVTSPLEYLAGEDSSDLGEYKYEVEAAGISDIEIPEDTTNDLISEQSKEKAGVLIDIEEQDNASSPIELTEKVDDQKPIILLEDEIAPPHSTLLEEIDAVLGEKKPSPEELMDSPPEDAIPVSEEPISDDAPEAEAMPAAVFDLDSDTQPPTDTMDETADEEPPAIDIETAVTPEWNTASAMDMEPAAEEALEIESDQHKEEEAESVLDIEMLESMMSDTFSGDEELINLDDVLGRRKDDIANTMDEADQPFEDDADISAANASNDFTIGIALDEIEMEEEGLSVSQDEIETAVERVIQKKYGQTIEQLIATTVEKMVNREIDSIRRSMLEDEDPID